MGYLIGRSSFVNIIFKLNVSSFYKPHWLYNIWIQAAELLLKDKNLFFFIRPLRISGVIKLVC